MLHVITLVFLFLARCRFPTQFSIISILQTRYGENFVKCVRKLENLDSKHNKAQVDLEFLKTCKKNNAIPKFLIFWLANRQLQSSHTYNICQKRLLNEEISNQHKLVAFDLISDLNDLKFVLHIIDFVNIITVFLTSNNKNILKFWNVRKLASYVLIILTTIHMALKKFYLILTYLRGNICL